MSRTIVAEPTAGTGTVVPQSDTSLGVQEFDTENTESMILASPPAAATQLVETAPQTTASSEESQSAYNFEIIAQTGTQFGNTGTITKLGWGPSINDFGLVAFTGRIQPAQQGANSIEGVFVSDGIAIERRTGLVDSFFYNALSRVTNLATAFDFGDVTQINNLGEIAYRVKAHDGLLSFILRLGSTPNDFKLVAKNTYPRIDFPALEARSPFFWWPVPAFALRPEVTINNAAAKNASRIIFSGVTKLCEGGPRQNSPCSTNSECPAGQCLLFSSSPRTLSTPQDTVDGGHDLAADFHFSAPLRFPDPSPDRFHSLAEFAPMLSDDNLTVVRGGADDSAPLVLFGDPTLSGAFFIATTKDTPGAISTDFTAIGKRSGISDDGRVIAFAAAHKTQGGGIFISVRDVIGPDTTYTVPFKIAGAESGLSAIFFGTRVGVNRRATGNANEFAVVFLAKRRTGGPPESDPLGLYVVRVDVTNPAVPVVLGAPTLVAEAGKAITGLDSLGRVQDILLYDPVNNSNQIVFWVKTDTGTEAIVRAESATLESFDANPLDAGPTVLDMIPRSGFSPDLDALAGFEPVDLGDIGDREVRAVAADGVTLLFLRLTVASGAEGHVTFSVESDTSEPLGSLWEVGLRPDKSPLISAEGDGAGDWEAESGPVPEKTTLTVPTHTYNGKTYAFALYRAPRDFDRGDVIGGDAWEEPVRRVRLRAVFSPINVNQPSSINGIDIAIVRPPVLFVHGTWDRPSSWYNFPLWKQSATKNNDYQFSDNPFGDPFVAYALDFEKNNDGRICTNAKLILAQIEEKLEDYRKARAFKRFGIKRVAATQADIVAQSVGGPVVRMASQLQKSFIEEAEKAGSCETVNEYDPLTYFYGNFRSFYNFGYGYIHKLITLSSTHKGSQLTPHTALVNSQSGGSLKSIARYRSIIRDALRIFEPIVGKNRIDCGIVADQNVVSDVLRKLKQTIFPSHAIVGSGIYEESIQVLAKLPEPRFVAIEQIPFGLLRGFSCLNPKEFTGPYCLQAGQDDLLPPNSFRPSASTGRRLVNYVFNLNHEKGASVSSEIPDDPRAWPLGNGPNYDLTVRLSSMEGGLRERQEEAVSDIFDMVIRDRAKDFAGKLTHLRNFESPEVSATVNFLLHISTSSQDFNRFPAVEAIIDDFDRKMLADFPDWKVKAFLKVGFPANSERDCFENEASERLNRGELASEIIR